MDQALVLGAFLLAGSSIVAWIKFWMEQGAVKQSATNAMSMATAAHGQVLMMQTELQKFQVEVAHESTNYVTQSALIGVEQRIATALADMRNDVRGMNSRLDRVLEAREG